MAECLIRERNVKVLKVAEILLGEINPRDNGDDIDDLTESIKRHGLLEPIIVHEKDAKFYLLAGHRRLKAAVQAGLTELSTVVFSDLSNSEVVQLAWEENEQRKDLTYQEKAHFLKRLRDEFSWDDKDLSEKLGIPLTTVKETLSLLSLPKNILESIVPPDGDKGNDGRQAKFLNYSKAVKLARLSSSNAFNRTTEQHKLFRRVVENGLTRDKLARLVEFVLTPSYDALSDKLKNLIVTNPHMTAELASLVVNPGDYLEGGSNEDKPFTEKDKITIAEHICRNQMSFEEAKNYIQEYAQKKKHKSTDSFTDIFVKETLKFKDFLLKAYPQIREMMDEDPDNSELLIEHMDNISKAVMDFKGEILRIKKGGERNDTVSRI